MTSDIGRGSTNRGDADTSRLATASLAAGDPTGWFDRLYAEAANGTAAVPWDLGHPSAMLVGWFADRSREVGRAAVVGCGYGRDAEFVASQGWTVTGFDVSPTAVDGARERHSDSPVTYVVADLLALPPEWLGAFDLVLESHNVQALPPDLHAAAVAAVASLVAPAGTLLVLAAVGADHELVDGPPWPLTRAEVEAFGSDELTAVSIESVYDDSRDVSRWRAEFARAEFARPCEPLR